MKISKLLLAALLSLLAGIVLVSCLKARWEMFWWADGDSVYVSCGEAGFSSGTVYKTYNNEKKCRADSDRVLSELATIYGYSVGGYVGNNSGGSSWNGGGGGHSFCGSGGNSSIGDAEADGICNSVYSMICELGFSPSSSEVQLHCQNIKNYLDIRGISGYCKYCQ